MAIRPPFVTVRLDGGKPIDFQVSPDDPVEIVMPEGQGERVLAELLGAEPLTAWEATA